jgi:hypothetical protein
MVEMRPKLLSRAFVIFDAKLGKTDIQDPHLLRTISIDYLCKSRKTFLIFFVHFF